MLEKARERVERKGVRNVRLLEMDAANLTFADDSFDIVYAPYVISVVPDPVRVVGEMRRVCRPGGKIIVLNHFRSPNPLLAKVERAISPFTVHIGFKSDLDLPGFLAQADYSRSRSRRSTSRGSGRSSPASKSSGIPVPPSTQAPDGRGRLTQSSKRTRPDILWPIACSLNQGVVYTHNILNFFNTSGSSREGPHDPRLDAWPAKSRVWRCITVRMPRRCLRDVDTRGDHDSGRTG